MSVLCLSPVNPGSSAHGVEAFLVVRVGARRCALPLASVRQVVRAMKVWPVPGSAPELAGLGQFGGEPIVVLDLLRLMDSAHGLEGDTGVVVVVRAGRSGQVELVGLAADDALDIVRVAGADVARTGQGALPGEVAIGDQLVRVLEPRALAQR